MVSIDMDSSLLAFSLGSDPQPSEPLPAAQFGGGDRCMLDLSGSTALGPNAGQTFQGSFSFSLDADGVIESGTLTLSDGTSVAVSGQAIGRSIRLRIGTDPADVVTFTGCGFTPLGEQCAGELAGAFTGPGLDNLGIWSATAHSGA